MRAEGLYSAILFKKNVMTWCVGLMSWTFQLNDDQKLYLHVNESLSSVNIPVATASELLIYLSFVCPVSTVGVRYMFTVTMLLLNWAV